jgi:hypothetical protein
VPEAGPPLSNEVSFEVLRNLSTTYGKSFLSPMLLLQYPSDNPECEQERAAQNMQNISASEGEVGAHYAGLMQERHCARYSICRPVGCGTSTRKQRSFSPQKFNQNCPPINII